MPLIYDPTRWQRAHGTPTRAIVRPRSGQGVRPMRLRLGAIPCEARSPERGDVACILACGPRDLTVLSC